ncbi:MAG: hypothetical protein OEZ59_08895 [Deltaproteobacteria bacterium]|nr:hypothetical protein [Deltaproteobacteria bacterium]
MELHSLKTAPANGRLGRMAAGMALLMILAMLAGCTPQQLIRQGPGQTCAEERMSLAYALYNEARGQLAQHFRTRTESSLEKAFQASVDSSLLARTARNCESFDLLIKREAINLIRINRLFQTLVISNMRDQDPGVVAGLYGDEYREIFRNDIR